jgi:hypothetical protein
LRVQYRQVIKFVCAKMLQMFSNFSWLFPLKISTPIYW